LSDEVLVERRGAVQLIVINRPEVRNALNLAVATGIRDAVDELDADDELRAGVLTGAGGAFSAGMDLKAFLRGEQVALPGRGLAGFTQAPPKKPLIAAVEGYALAGGFELALACDLIVAAENAKFGIPEIKRGLVAAGGGLLRLPRRIPQNVAMEYALTGEFFSAADGQRLGLVNRVTPSGAALEGAIELAKRITANAPLSITATKEVIVRSADWTAEDMWRKQQEITQPVFGSADAKEGASAFAGKRAPVWRGE
jgi:enoyl-CoA hydratase